MRTCGWKRCGARNFGRKTSAPEKRPFVIRSFWRNFSGKNSFSQRCRSATPTCVRQTCVRPYGRWICVRMIYAHWTYVPGNRCLNANCSFCPVSHHEMIFLRPFLFSVLEVSAAE